MGEVLSQNEIDSLLKALSSGELDVDEIKDDNEKQIRQKLIQDKFQSLRKKS